MAPGVPPDSYLSGFLMRSKGRDRAWTVLILGEPPCAYGSVQNAVVGQYGEIDRLAGVLRQSDFLVVG
ncbi:hypothetical protein, partial [Streptomyces sp. NPDC005181]|uniref:hypothetical protein n=1 Tax=Streptomyces sp. NPDC005181 TaxID=3156869 RepID=UPI0033B6B2AC